MKKIFIILLVSTLALNACKDKTKKPAETTTEKSAIKEDLNVVFIGTYTKKEGHVNGQAEGIYTVYQNSRNGQLEMGKTVAEITNPSFVKVSDDGKNLYAVSELGAKDAASGFVYSYSITKNDSLIEIGKISTEGFAPCHIAMDQTDEYVFVSNYVGGVVVLYQRGEDGALRKKQEIEFENPKQSHPHSVSISADNKTAYIADLGNDKIWIFDFNASKGKLTPNEQKFMALEPGSGPRHLAFSKNQDFVYSINELNNTVSTFKILENRDLQLLQNISSLPEEFTGKSSAAEIEVHPSGKYLYVSNRGHNSIASYAIDALNGKLSLLGFSSTQGKNPRHFTIAPAGNFLYVANQDSNSITTFNVNEKTGKLTSILEPLNIKTPVCIDFVDVR